ncbi:hypothetical protein [Bernardetia sp.]|uniref:hypothetical protein n=1 Tax=Bernardetia sp. TaxID=1937974 RepID=UPI0025C67196|nr:hypothetical protein [Bernardetia sp.]
MNYYIPNQKEYHFTFPMKVLAKYNGLDNLDTTVDDTLIPIILEPILKKQVEYKFDFLWDKKNNSSLTICFQLNEEKFSLSDVINNLQKNEMIEGLKVLAREYGKMVEAFHYEKT